MMRRRTRVALAAAALLTVRSWVVQLQEVDLQALGATAYDVIVIDYSASGDDDSAYTAAQISALKAAGPCGGHTVLAYLSIGEAEDYRYYFQPGWVRPDGQPGPAAPAWLGPTNPQWKGNYKVRYWQRDWQRVLFGIESGPARGYLERILDAGFDGVYLDIIDGYEYWGPAEIDGNDERRQAPADMVTLVQRLAQHARRAHGRADFIVVPQNGSSIVAPASFPDAPDPRAEAARQRRRYLASIDGIGAEDTFFYGSRDVDNPWRPQRQVIAALDGFAAAGKAVLAMDYLTQASKIDTFFAQATARGWAAYAAPDRDLARFATPAGHEPGCTSSPASRR